jgi:diguanylate cyclase (GGDEF)-like protein
LARLAQRVAWWVDGDLARLPPATRRRLVAWQETRTRVALGHLFTLLTLIAVGKVALVASGIWPTSMTAAGYALALSIMLAGRFGYLRARGLVMEGISATAFLLALVAIFMDPTHGWAENPGLAMGWVWMLAALGIPVLARFRSVLVFATLLALAVWLFFVYVPLDKSERPGIVLYLVTSISGGMLLRRLRSDLTLDFRRTTDAAWKTANTDALTGLANRRGWREQAPAILETCAYDQRPVSLLFMDLDHFKQLNDFLGHSAGDDALNLVGTMLSQGMGQGFAARLGGEEFVCLLPGMDAPAAQAFAAALAQDLRGGKPSLTYSGGIAQWQPGESLKDLLARGDAAMYRAKQGGRDRVEVG